MPNIYPFLKSEKWGKLLTVLSVLGICGTAVAGTINFISAQSQTAANIENGVTHANKEIDAVKTQIGTVKEQIKSNTDLFKEYVPRVDLDRSDEQREKRFLEAKESIEKSIDQMRHDQKEFQTEQRAVNREILKILSAR